jgi:hypothetical protein
MDLIIELYRCFREWFHDQLIETEEDAVEL